MLAAATAALWAKNLGNHLAYYWATASGKVLAAVWAHRKATTKGVQKASHWAAALGGCSGGTTVPAWELSMGSEKGCLLEQSLDGSRDLRRAAWSAR